MRLALFLLGFAGSIFVLLHFVMGDSDAAGARWMPVSDSLPCEGVRVLVWHREAIQVFVYRPECGGYFEDLETTGKLWGVTHWMACPFGPLDSTEGK
jgi:hypothetical protein